jgi:uncharacterized glyoxalase superfamily protein PhnB
MVETMPNRATTEAKMYPCLFYDDAPAAIDWLCNAFGFTKRLVVPGPDGTVAHSELSYGPGVIMVGSARPDQGRLGPRSLPGVTQSLCVRVDNPDAHFARAKACGATIVRDLQDEEHGSRGYTAKDLEGHEWYFGTYRPGAYWTQQESR